MENNHQHQSQHRLNFSSFLENMIEIVDFRIQEGRRQYKSKWLRGDGRYIYKWLFFDQMAPQYVKQIFDYEVSHNILIRNCENEWLQLFAQNRVKNKLQILNLQKIRKTFFYQRREHSQEKSSDSSYQICKRKQKSKLKKPIEKKAKGKNKRNKKEGTKRNIGSNKFLMPQKSKDYSQKQITKTQTIRLMDHLLLSQKASPESRPNEKESQSIILSISAKEPQINNIENTLQDKNVSVIEQNVQEISSSEQMVVVRRVLTDEQQSDNDSQEYSFEEEQLSLSSDNVSQILNHDNVKQFIERKLFQIQHKQKQKQRNSCEQSIKLQVQEGKRQQRFSQFQGNLKKQFDYLDQLILEFQTKSSVLGAAKESPLPKCFQQFIKSNLISQIQMKQEKLRIINVINAYCLNQAIYFCVNVGSTYFEQQRFIDINILKIYCPQILRQWLLCQ